MRTDENVEPLRNRRDAPRFIEDVSARSSGAARIAPTSARERFVPSAHILKHLPIGLAVQRAGRLIRVNQRLLDLLGYTREVQVVGRPVLELIVPEDWPTALAQIQRAAFRRGDGGSELLRFIHRNAQPVPVLVTLTLHSDGEIPVVIATCLPADGPSTCTCGAARPDEPEPGCEGDASALSPAEDAPVLRAAASTRGRAGRPPATLLEVAAAVEEAAETDDEAVATLHHLLESGRVKRRP